MQPYCLGMDHPWPGDWMRGVLEVCVLRVLADGPTYGYAIGARLADAGLGAPKGGTLYPLLSRFEAAGLVRVEWRAGESGPGRKYYELTDDGRTHLATQAERWTRFTHLTTTLITAPTSPGEQPPAEVATQDGAPS